MLFYEERSNREVTDGPGCFGSGIAGRFLGSQGGAMYKSMGENQ